MFKLKLIFILAIVLPAWSFAQTAQSQELRVDSLTQKNALKITSFIIPSVFIGYGIAAGYDNPIRDLDRTTRAELQEDHPFFSIHADNYMQYVPAAAVFALNFSGLKGRHSIGDAAGYYAVTMAIMTASTRIIKSQTYRLRPDGTTNNSFPSGHTATSFAAAEFLRQEYKDVSPWIGYAGYLVAGSTGILRIYNNRHWVSDVVAGVGFGVISTKLGYFLYPHLKRLVLGKGVQHYAFVPTYQEGAVGFALSGSF